jgi:hypothetical protein
MLHVASQQRNTASLYGPVSAAVSAAAAHPSAAAFAQSQRSEAQPPPGLPRGAHLPSLSLPRAVELSIDRGAKGPTQPPMQLAIPVRSRHRCGAAAALPRLPTLPYRTVPYLHCAAPSGAPTGRPGFNPADLRGVQPGFNLRGVQPAVQLVDRVEERGGFAHRRRTHLPEGRSPSDGGIVSAESVAFIREATGFARQAQSGRAVPHTLPQSTRTPQHTTAHHSIHTNGTSTLRPPCRRPRPKGRTRCAAAVRRSAHGVLTAAAGLCSTPKW